MGKHDDDFWTEELMEEIMLKVRATDKELEKSGGPVLNPKFMGHIGLTDHKDD